MQSFFHFVLSDPKAYEKLCKEVRGANLSPSVTWAEAQELSYFQACLLEAMRLRPAVGLDIPRTVPSGGAKIDGTFYPGGITASINGWSVHRTPLFGDQVDEFRPERWSSEDAKEMKKHMYQVSKDDNSRKSLTTFSLAAAAIFALEGIWRYLR